MKNRSIEKKRNIAGYLAWYVGYKMGLGYIKHFEHKNLNEIWGVIDCGFYGDTVISGECSLKAQLDFEIDDFENQLDSFIIDCFDTIKDYRKSTKTGN